MRRFVIALILVLHCVVGASPVDTLLNKPERPTMSEVEDVLPILERSLPEHIPVSAATTRVYFDKRLNIPVWMAKLLHHGPRLIATFESVYPGATWVFLGRDGLPWADLFEAFYSSIGQPDRVVRLGISKPTMANVTDADLVKLLRSHGIKAEDLPPGHPVIFVDSISRGAGRQARRLMGAVYASWIAKGEDPLSLAGKLDMIGLIVSTFEGQGRPFDQKAFHHFQRALTLLDFEDQTVQEMGAQISDQLQVLTYPEQGDHGNEAGYTHFIGAWHDSFQEIERLPNNRYQARPGPVYPLEMRQSILWLQGQIWNFVNSGKCESDVIAWARNLGYKFPIQRPAAVAVNLNKLAKWKASLKNSEGRIGMNVAMNNFLNARARPPHPGEILTQLPIRAFEGRYFQSLVLADPRLALEATALLGAGHSSGIIGLIAALRDALEPNCESMLKGRP